MGDSTKQKHTTGSYTQICQHCDRRVGIKTDLSNNRHSMTELCLAASKLAIYFANASSLEATRSMLSISHEPASSFLHLIPSEFSIECRASGG